MSDIEWTGKTWNPIVGCSKVSAGCKNCYAVNQAYRNAAMGAKLQNPGRLRYYQGLTEKKGDRVDWTGTVNFVPEALDIPLKRKKPTTYFVNSMSDLFHSNVSDEVIDKIFAVMAMTPRHTYQILTKRPERMLRYLEYADAYSLSTRADRVCKASHEIWDQASVLKPPLEWPLSNVWLGVSVEDQKTANERIATLLEAPAAVRFLSCEPLLEGLDLTKVAHHYRLINALNGQWQPCGVGAGGAVAGGRYDSSIDWVIAGGESGHGARPCNAKWLQAIVNQCKANSTPVFVKQLGAKPIGIYFFKTSRKGNIPDDWPESLRIREFPKQLG